MAISPSQLAGLRYGIYTKAILTRDSVGEWPRDRALTQTPPGKLVKKNEASIYVMKVHLLGFICISFVSNAVSRYPGFVCCPSKNLHDMPCSCCRFTRGLHIRANTVYNSDSDQEVVQNRARYFEERRKREKLLLKYEPSLYANHSNEVPEYISRWGGADLAQEGPTRKLLELMNDSEW